MLSGPVVGMVWQGLSVVKTGRLILGETNPLDSNPGTIRGDFCVQSKFTSIYCLFLFERKFSNLFFLQ